MNRLRLLSALTAAGLLPVLVLAQSATLQTTVIESDGPGEMVSTDTETTITFRDRVVVTGTNLKLNCDFLEVVVKRKGDASATIGTIAQFRSMLATGNVLLVQGDREAACGRAEVLPEEERVILTEDPVVVDHDQKTRIRGKKITLLRGQRQVLVEKPTLTGPPAKDLGYDKDKKSATPPAAK
jgi:lipopolysaccharide export system protein LptA